MTVHIVAQSETLVGIARVYGTTAQAIAEANNLADPDLIFPGQSLVIPSASQVGSLSYTDQRQVVLEDVTIDAGGEGIGLRLIRSHVVLRGQVTVRNFASLGVQVGRFSHLQWENCTLTIEGAGVGYGMHVFGHSLVDLSYGGGAVTVRNCGVGVQLGLAGMFQIWHGDPASTTIEDCGSGVQCTDHSSWSTSQPLTMRRVGRPFDLNSISYAEASGPRTFENCGGNRASQNSVLYLP